MGAPAVSFSSRVFPTFSGSIFCSQEYSPRFLFQFIGCSDVGIFNSAAVWWTTQTHQRQRNHPHHRHQRPVFWPTGQPHPSLLLTDSLRITLDDLIIISTIISPDVILWLAESSFMQPNRATNMSRNRLKLTLPPGSGTPVDSSNSSPANNEE